MNRLLDLFPTGFENFNRFRTQLDMREWVGNMEQWRCKRERIAPLMKYLGCLCERVEPVVTFKKKSANFFSYRSSFLFYPLLMQDLV